MKRRLARMMAVQCLYQIELNDVSVEDALEMIVEQTKEENELQIHVADENSIIKYATQITKGTLANQSYIDELIADYLKGWQMDRLSRVDLQILRLAVYEMVFGNDDVPPKVVINEAIELAKHFGFEESGKFVNGVLGNLIKDIDDIRLKVKEKL